MSDAMGAVNAMGRAICGARGRAGKPCGRPAGAGTDHPGYGACKNHGGSTPNHITHHLRLVETLIPAAVSELQRLLSDPSVADAVKLRTAQDILDRTGVGAKSGLDLDITLTVEDRRAAIAARAEALLAGAVIDTTVAEPVADEDGGDE